mmetsp:Transcript_113629/g.367564  ORF Transcript_113629/g.367564 Transcript_113629/m.367564 type:complete len:210 (+) Transcript_113629:676-1305(+)
MPECRSEGRQAFVADICAPTIQLQRGHGLVVLECRAQGRQAFVADICAIQIQLQRGQGLVVLECGAQGRHAFVAEVCAHNIQLKRRQGRVVLKCRAQGRKHHVALSLPLLSSQHNAQLLQRCIPTDGGGGGHDQRHRKAAQLERREVAVVRKREGDLHTAPDAPDLFADVRPKAPIWIWLKAQLRVATRDGVEQLLHRGHTACDVVTHS